MEKVQREQLGDFAKRMLELVPAAREQATLITLEGDLGAGKTTFAQALGKELGVEDVMQSPTYVLMKSYPINYKTFTKLVHIDAYRLNNPQEFNTLKPEEFLNDPKNLVVLEWPQKAGHTLPVPDLTLSFSSQRGEEDSRYIEVTQPRRSDFKI